jgi:hypothetical protein
MMVTIVGDMLIAVDRPGGRKGLPSPVIVTSNRHQ